MVAAGSVRRARDVRGCQVTPARAGKTWQNQEGGKRLLCRIYPVWQADRATQPGGVGDLGELGEICFNFFLLQPS